MSLKRRLGLAGAHGPWNPLNDSFSFSLLLILLIPYEGDKIQSISLKCRLGLAGADGPWNPGDSFSFSLLLILLD